MNQAMQNEQLAIQQKLIESYRAQLFVMQQKLETVWQKSIADFENQSEGSAGPAIFSQAIRTNLADAIVAFDGEGEIIYPPSAPVPKSVRATGEWIAAQSLESSDRKAAARAYGLLRENSTDADVAARAWQAQLRCLFQAGENSAALGLLGSVLQGGHLDTAKDAQGRLIVPNALLLALEFPAEVEIREKLRAALHTRLTDYDSVAFPPAQRRFLMREFQSRFANSSLTVLLAAEELAAAYLESGKGSLNRESGLRPSPLPGIWQYFSPRGRVVALYRGDTLPTRLRAMIPAATFPSDVDIDFVSPGQETGRALVILSAGATMPGWHLALSVSDVHLRGSGVSGRISSYLWIGAVMVVIAVLLAVLAWGLMRRQIALTELRNDLVANVTHELKTPLASMRLLVETLLNTSQLNEQTTREYLQLIATENLRLSRLIGNFLTFSRIERNKYTFDFNGVSPAVVVDKAVAAVRDRFGATGCRFEVSVSPRLPLIKADTDALVTALVNLLDNAWKYSGEARHIVLAVKGSDRAVGFSVKDNGIGLSSRDTKRIFQRFHQVHGHLSTAGGGCGLGLSIVQFIVSAHGGTIQVDSEAGRGSTFIITLPVQTTISGSSDKP